MLIRKVEKMKKANNLTLQIIKKYNHKTKQRYNAVYKITTYSFLFIPIYTTYEIKEYN